MRTTLRPHYLARRIDPDGIPWGKLPIITKSPRIPTDGSRRSNDTFNLMILYQRIDSALNPDRETWDSAPHNVDAKPVDAAHTPGCCPKQVMRLGHDEQYRPTAANWRR